MIPRAVYQPQIVVMDRLDLRVRTAGYNLDRIPSVSYILRDLKQFILQEQVLLRRIVPVQDKPLLWLHIRPDIQLLKRKRAGAVYRSRQSEIKK